MPAYLLPDKPITSAEDYAKTGGWKGLERALSLSPEAVIDEIKKSGLRGRGGAGFPTAIKWAGTRQKESPDGKKYLACNGAGCPVGAVRRTRETCRLAECAVENWRKGDERDHRREYQKKDEQRLGVLVLGNRGVHQFIPVFAMVMKKSSTTNRPSSKATIRARSR